MKLIRFEDALKDSHGLKRHLILGNGFSIACRADIFHYGSLFNQANFDDVPEVTAVFEALDTQDFEAAIRALESAAVILPAYVADDDRAATGKMLKHVKALKEILVKTIAVNHPVNPANIQDNEFMSCRHFLNHFLAPELTGHVFTLNYDLLLYWTLMHDGDPLHDNDPKLRKNDSFGNDEDEPDAEYVVWQGETAAHSANIHYLHGALHLFDAGPELQKFTWIRSGIPLVEQATQALAADKFPLFVAEGTSVQKKKKIRHNAYLYQGFKVLTANANKRNHCFFIFGHSLNENDDHILRRLGKGAFEKLYVGIFGDPIAENNQNIKAKANVLAAMRQVKKPLEVVFYDAATANVWR